MHSSQTAPRTAALCLVAALGLAGCASNKEARPAAEMPDPDRGHRQTVDFGVSYVTPTSDTVQLVSRYDHVLLPDGASRLHREVATTHVPTRYAPTDDELQEAYELLEQSPTASPEPTDVSRSTQEAKIDPVRQAWERYCDLATGMTAEDWELVTSTDIPEDLQPNCLAPK